MMTMSWDMSPIMCVIVSLTLNNNNKKIDNKLVVFWLNLLFEYLCENTSGWLQLKKVKL